MHLYLAEKAQNDKDLKTAATHYRAALTIAPDNALTLNNLAWVLSELGAIYRAQGRHEDAQRCLRRSLRFYQEELGPDHPIATHDLHQLAGCVDNLRRIAGSLVHHA